MKKIVVVLIASLWLLTACKEKTVIEPDVNLTEESDADTEIVVDGVDDSLVTEENTFISVRKEELRGGKRIVDLHNQLLVTDIKETTLDNQYAYELPVNGLERGKTYQLSIVFDQIMAHKVSIIDGDTEEIYYTWDSPGGDEAFSASFVFTPETNTSLITKVVTDEQIVIEEISLIRVVGELQFSDEFNYEGLPDEEKWSYEVGGHGFGNGELQYYTGGNLKNVEVKDGFLYITAQIEEIGNNKYSSTRMKSLANVLYGRVEVRAQLPFGYGTWPAIWMLPTTDRYGTWPSSGEIDIMEHVGYDMDTVHGSVHTGAFNHRKNNHPTGTMTIPKVDTTFHVYAIEWSPYAIDFYIDDYLYLTFKNDGQDFSHWPFDGNFYLIMNIAIGGGWGGQQGIDDSVFPQQMVVDYVRIYNLEDEVVDTTSPTVPKIKDVEIIGNIVNLEWEPSKDDYLVDYYEIWIDNQIIATSETNFVTLFSLESESVYNIGLYAVDIVGNKSEMELIEVTTDPIDYVNVPSIIEVDEIFYNNAGQIAFNDQQDSYLQYLEDSESMIYAFNVEETTEYVLEISYHAKVFDGIVSLESISGELFTELVLERGCEDTWCVATSEPFVLEKGQQLIRLNIIKGNFKLDFIQIKYHSE